MRKNLANVLPMLPTHSRSSRSSGEPGFVLRRLLARHLCMRRQYDAIFRALLNMESVIGLTQTVRAHHTEGVSSPCKAFWYTWLR